MQTQSTSPVSFVRRLPTWQGLLLLVGLLFLSTGQPGVALAGELHTGNRLLALAGSPNRPVLAFFYGWYNYSDWCSCHMSDLPAVRYRSSDDATIDRQLKQAVNAGINGFISSWWGMGSPTDQVFSKLLQHSAALQKKTGQKFTSTLYIESDAPALRGQAALTRQLQAAIHAYGNSPYFFHWQGHPVIFIWSPLGNGRTLAEWRAIRKKVDPGHHQVWSAEGVSASLLDVFDGIHLFSAGYWGLAGGNMGRVDQGFRAMVNNYNRGHHTHKIWAAGVLPGYDDTRIPGRQGAYKVPRNGGATYRESWNGALSSSPDWITITSYNEWFEGSMIEPSVSYHNHYLQITHDFAKRWHG